MIRKIRIYLKNLFFKPVYKVFLTDDDNRLLVLNAACYPEIGVINISLDVPMQEWTLRNISKMKLIKQWGRMCYDLKYLHSFTESTLNYTNNELAKAMERNEEKHYLNLRIEFDPVIFEFYKLR